MLVGLQKFFTVNKC